MIQIDISKLNSSEYSYYFIVVGIAKRAREIYDGLDIRVKQDDAKPVSLAIDEFLNHKYVFSVNNKQ